VGPITAFIFSSLILYLLKTSTIRSLFSTSSSFVTTISLLLYSCNRSGPGILKSGSSPEGSNNSDSLPDGTFSESLSIHISFTFSGFRFFEDCCKSSESVFVNKYFTTLSQSGKRSLPNCINSPLNSPAPFFVRSSIRKSPLFRSLRWDMISLFFIISGKYFWIHMALSVHADVFFQGAVVRM